MAKAWLFLRREKKTPKPSYGLSKFVTEEKRNNLFVQLLD